jgi:hypothetical protein
LRAMLLVVSGASSHIRPRQNPNCQGTSGAGFAVF